MGRICVEAYQEPAQLEDGPKGGYGLVLADAAARYRDALVLVAVRNDEVVGTVTITPEGSPFREIGQDGEVEFRFLAVAPSAWGGGVGTALIEACLAHAREVGSHRIAICVRDTNVGAMARTASTDSLGSQNAIGNRFLKSRCWRCKKSCEWAQPDSNR